MVSMADIADIIPFPQEEPETAPAFSEEAIALDFAAANEPWLRHVAASGRWMIFDGTKWSVDTVMATFSEVRATCRIHANKADAGVRRRIASAATVAGVERLARSDHRLAATVDQWDADPWLLNTPSGMVDLRLGTNWGHSPDHYATKITGAEHFVITTTPCPLWHTFLDRITGGDIELQDFLRRLFGYSLTGSTREHALFFFFGTGANGKSVLLSTIADVMGDYAKTAPIETFVASSFDRHPTELAGLQGARMVTATETEEGRAWAEARIKVLTGGDKIAARFMRQNFFEFTPQFKLIIAGNHKPRLKNVDEAIRRRFFLVPFTVTIPANERDPNLRQKLRAEWPGILAWMIQGCREWQKIGLKPPAAVTNATSDYMAAEDAVANWIAECCLTGAGYAAKSSDLFASWSAWAKRAGELPGTNKSVSATLETRGYHRRRGASGMLFQGITVAPRMLGDD